MRDNTSAGELRALLLYKLHSLFPCSNVHAKFHTLSSFASIPSCTVHTCPGSRISVSRSKNDPLHPNPRWWPPIESWSTPVVSRVMRGYVSNLTLVMPQFRAAACDTIRSLSFDGCLKRRNSKCRTVN